MAYNKQSWVNAPATTTPLSAARLGVMEDGIEAAANVADAAAAATAAETIARANADATETAARIAAAAAARHHHITTRSWGPGLGLSDGVVTSANYRCRHVVPAAATDLRMVLGNFEQDPGGGLGELTAPSTITVRASFEYDGVFYPVYFNGARDVALQAGSQATSDVVGFEVRAGSDLYTRVFVSVTSGGKWARGVQLYAVNGEGGVASTSATDGTTTGTIAPVDVIAYTPLAVLGLPTAGNTPSSVLVIGDSVVQRQDTASTSQGYPAIALGRMTPFINIGEPTETALTFTTSRAARSRIFQNATHALVEYGVNDLSASYSLEKIKTSLLNIWTTLTNRGLKVYQSTITPRGTSTDVFATVGNQTTATSNPVRIALNAWIRTTPAPLSGFFEVADAVESARDSGFWKAPGYTTDGIHPTYGVGMTAAATGVDTTVFTGVTPAGIAYGVKSAIPIGWWKRDSLTNLTNGASVALWSDASLSGWLLQKAPTGPTWNTGVLGGSVDHSNGGFLLNDQFAGLSQATGYTTFIVFKAQALTAGYVYGVYQACGMFFSGSQLYTYAGPGPASFGTFNFNDTTAPHIVEQVYDGTQSTGATRLVALLDGVAKTLTISGTVPTNTLGVVINGFAIGQEYGNVSPAAMCIAEVLVYPTALSAADRSLIRVALGAKYSITVTP